MGWRLAVGVSVMWVALAFLGDGLATLVLPAILAATPDAATTIGLISFAGLGAAVLVQPIAGTLSDAWRGHVDRRRFIAVAALATIVALGSLAAAQSIAAIAGAFILTMLAASTLQAGQQTLIPEHVRSTSRGRAASLKTAFDIGGAFVAFLVLGVVLESGGVPVANLGTALVLVAAAALMAVFVPSSGRGTHGATTRADHVRRRIPDGFWPLVIARFLFLVGIYVVGRFLLLLVAERLAIPGERAVAETGGLLALFTLTTAAVALLIGPALDRAGRRRVAVVGGLVGGAGVASFLVPGGLVGVVIAGTLMSVGTAAFTTANWAALTDVSPAGDAGRLMGLANLGTGGAAALAGLAGPSIDAWGFAPALLAATAAIVLSLAPIARSPRLRPVEALT